MPTPTTTPTTPDRDLHTSYKVWLIEKLIINFAMPMDFVFHTFRALFQKDTSQTPRERLWGLWSGKVAKYQKLLRIKDELGKIPDDWRDICMQTPCGKTRYFLAKHANPARRRRKPKPVTQPSRLHRDANLPHSQPTPQQPHIAPGLPGVTHPTQ